MSIIKDEKIDTTDMKQLIKLVRKTFNPVKIAEVIRDLFRKNSQPEQSYSERQMFQVALERLAREVAAVEKTDYFQSTEKIESLLRNK